jgi:muconolactone delta-isomerase
MLFLFIGYGTKLKLLGAVAERICPRCHNTASWRRLERYRYLSLFFVRVARWHREQLDACPVCGYAEARTDPPGAHRGSLADPVHA